MIMGLCLYKQCLRFQCSELQRTLHVTFTQEEESSEQLQASSETKDKQEEEKEKVEDKKEEEEEEQVTEMDIPARQEHGERGGSKQGKLLT